MAARFSAGHAGRLLYFSMCLMPRHILNPNGNLASKRPGQSRRTAIQIDDPGGSEA
jgi:hypothetical protein